MLKMIHRQFIDLAIGLAKAGIVTNFKGQNCGAIEENGELTVKYYLEPKDVEITDDFEYIEEAVSEFCARAMEYMQSCHKEGNKPGRLPEKELCESVESVKEEKDGQTKLLQ